MNYLSRVLKNDLTVLGFSAKMIVKKTVFDQYYSKYNNDILIQFKILYRFLF